MEYYSYFKDYLIEKEKERLKKQQNEDISKLKLIFEKPIRNELYDFSYYCRVRGDYLLDEFIPVFIDANSTNHAREIVVGKIPNKKYKENLFAYCADDFSSLVGENVFVLPGLNNEEAIEVLDRALRNIKKSKPNISRLGSYWKGHELISNFNYLFQIWIAKPHVKVGTTSFSWNSKSGRIPFNSKEEAVGYFRIVKDKFLDVAAKNQNFKVNDNFRPNFVSAVWDVSNDIKGSYMEELYKLIRGRKAACSIMVYIEKDVVHSAQGCEFSRNN